MKILVATDSFKGCLTSSEAGNAIKTGIEKLHINADITVMPMADGGEGTCKAIADALNAQYRNVEVASPYTDSKIEAEYALSDNLAIIEMASASGLMLVPKDKRNPLYTTTYGVGEMIADAYKNGAREFIIGIGGSATNDCGIGMLSALGFVFYDKNGNPVPNTALGLKDIAEIKNNCKLKDCTFTVACDVDNPLYGKNGCSFVFGKQKGASDTDIANMDIWIEGFSRLANKTFGTAYENEKGAGAAGGLGYAFMTFLNAKLQNGAELVLNKTSILEKIPENDIVITGEGRMDSQSLNGKAPITLAKIAKSMGKKVYAFCGIKADFTTEFLDGCFPISENLPLEIAMQKSVATQNLINTAEKFFSKEFK